MPVPSSLLAWTPPAIGAMRRAAERLAKWLDGIDPGGRHRIRGLRLVAAFAIASMGGLLAVPGARSLDASASAGTFAIWASVYETAATRRRGCLELVAMIAASALGAAGAAVWTGIAGNANPALSLLPLAGGAFLVDYLKRYPAPGTGIGSVAFIGQAVGFGLGLGIRDLPMIGIAALIAAAVTAALRILAGPSERDADALSRCRDFRRIMASRLRRYHDALHHEDEAGLVRIGPRIGELNSAWAALDALVRREFTERDLIAGYLRAELQHLYALLQTVLAVGDSMTELLERMPGLRDRAALGLVLHTLRRVVLLQEGETDAVLAGQLRTRCERLVQRAVAMPETAAGDAAGDAIEVRIAMLRIGLVAGQGAGAGPPTGPAPAPAPGPEIGAEIGAATGAGAPPAGSGGGRGLLPTTRVAVQAGFSALVIIGLNAALGMDHMLWALAASTYVISSSVADTWSRGLRRIAGTAVGVVLGLGVALLFAQVPVAIWGLAALAMVIYSVALRLRYDVACGAYAFALVVTLAAAGDSSWNAATARGLDTFLGAAIGMAVSAVVLPVRLRDQLAAMLAALLTEARDHVAASVAWASGGGGAAPVVTSADLLADIEAQKARFAGLRVEGILARDGDGGALLLLRIESLVDTAMRLVGEARLAQAHADAGLCASVAGLAAQLRAAFDAVLARLRREGRPALPPSDAVLPPLRAYMAARRADPAAATGVLLVAALTYSGRKAIRTLADLAAEIDRRDGTPPAVLAR